MKKVIFANDYDQQHNENLTNESSVLLTPAALVDFLSQVEELSHLDIGVDHVGDNITVHIGQSSYSLEPKGEETEVEVEPEDIQEVNDAAEEAYNQIDNLEDIETVESGIIKEFIKTLAIGGLVRLAAKKLKK